MKICWYYVNEVLRLNNNNNNNNNNKSRRQGDYTVEPASANGQDYPQ